jgi:hypothetical protein
MTKMKTLATVAIGLAVSTAANHAAFSEWTTVSGGNGHSYEAVYTPAGITWDDAKTASIAAGGHLATITSAAENTFVFNLISDSKFWQTTYFGVSGVFKSGPFLGGYESNPSIPNTTWSWVTGESFVYSNWEQVQPDNLGGVQHVLVFGGLDTIKATWDDSTGPITHSTLLGYIIEKNGLTAVPEPSTYIAGLSALGMLFLGYRSRK